VKILIIAILCALAVPTAQLRMVSTITTCCCPDPHHCHCPDHKATPGQHDASMRACHRQTHEFVSPLAPVFTPAAELVALAPPDRALPLVAAPLRSPHAPPALPRPDAPS
jgi:hypothetical protein